MSTTFTLEKKNLVLENCKPGISFQDKTFSLDFQVRTSAASNAAEVSIWLDSNLPRSLSDFSDESESILAYALLSDYSVQPEDDNNPTVFSGKATYIQAGGDTATKVNFGTVAYDKVVVNGLDEVDSEEQQPAILNSAGDRFSEPVIEQEHRLLITIEKAYSSTSASPEGVRQYINTINSSQITIADVTIPAKGGWLKNIVPRLRILSIGTYDWVMQIEIEVKTNGETYDRKLLDQGFYYLEEFEYGDSEPPNFVGWVTKVVNGQTKYYRKLRATTQNPDTGEYEPATEPILLDGAGGKLESIDPGEEKYLEYRTKREMDWSILGLPTTVWETV